jgi:hypothetical protein
MKNLYLFLGLLIVSLFFGCKKEEPVKWPEVSTIPITNITTRTATSGGTLTFVGLAEIFSNGVCWNKTGNPSTADSKTVDSIGNPQFISTISGLDGNTIYHLRAYAINSFGTTYGNEIPFSTLGTPPILTILPPTNLTSTGAILNGEVNPNGDSLTVSFKLVAGTHDIVGTFMTSEQNPLTGFSIIHVSAQVSFNNGPPPPRNRSWTVSLKAKNSWGTFSSEELSFKQP